MNKGEEGFSCGVVFRHLFNVGVFWKGFLQGVQKLMVRSFLEKSVNY